MSIGTIAVILDRVRHATPRSRIAVFLTRDGELDAVFANTVAGDVRIKTDLALVGVFDNTHDDRDVFLALRAAVNSFEKPRRQKRVKN